MVEDTKPRGFWQTFPGVLTAVAGVITAITSLFVVLKQTDATSHQVRPHPESQRETGMPSEDLDREPTTIPDKTLARKSSVRSESQLEKAIVGTWEYRGSTPEGVFIEVRTSYAPSGHLTAMGKATFQGQQHPLIVSGRWQVKDSYLHSTVDTSNVPFLIPNGFTDAVEIISISAHELTYRDSMAGQTVVESRVE